MFSIFFLICVFVVFVFDRDISSLWAGNFVLVIAVSPVPGRVPWHTVAPSKYWTDRLTVGGETDDLGLNWLPSGQLWLF